MLSAGANGVSQGAQALRDVAQEVAELNVSESRTSAPAANTDRVAQTAELMVDLKLYQRQVQASAKVVETADEVIGFLLDVKA
jgi:hypothetical protein